MVIFSQIRVKNSQEYLLSVFYIFFAEKDNSKSPLISSFEVAKALQTHGFIFTSLILENILNLINDFENDARTFQ